MAVDKPCQIWLSTVLADGTLTQTLSTQSKLSWLCGESLGKAFERKTCDGCQAWSVNIASN